LDEFFETRVDASPADVPWSRVAAVLAINRLCAPGSELAIEERWYPTTALDDLLHVPDGTINDSRLYRALDHMLPHKTALERTRAKAPTCCARISWATRSRSSGRSTSS
jgi:hypothetical protein